MENYWYGNLLMSARECWDIPNFFPTVWLCNRALSLSPTTEHSMQGSFFSIKYLQSEWAESASFVFILMHRSHLKSTQGPHMPGRNQLTVFSYVCHLSSTPLRRQAVSMHLSIDTLTTSWTIHSYSIKLAYQRYRSMTMAVCHRLAYYRSLCVHDQHC